MIATRYPMLIRYENLHVPLVYAMYDIIRDYLRNVVQPKVRSRSGRWLALSLAPRRI